MNGKTEVSIQLYDYYNTGHRTLKNKCCDVLCISSCDNYFEICITTFPVKDGAHCLLSAKTKVFDDNDDLEFPRFGQEIGKNLRNPLTFTYDAPFVSCFVCFFLFIFVIVPLLSLILPSILLFDYLGRN